MGGFIIIDDGRAIAPNNWSYDRCVEKIADSLPLTLEGRKLAEWLLDQRVSVKGIGSVDVRELTPQNQHLFWQAVSLAVERCEREGPSGWCDPDFWTSWMNGFRTLVKLRESFLRGEPPESFNPDMTAAIPPTGERSGPGW